MSENDMPNDASAALRRDFLKMTAGALSTTALAGYVGASDTLKVGVIGCGGRGEAAAMNAMNADKGIRIVAMGDIRLDRVQEKRSALKLKYPDQVAVDDDHCFQGFDAYREVIE